MLSLVSSSVRVSLLLLISSDIHRCVALITCEAGTFEFGKPASITCNFRTNITATRKSFNMALYPKDAPKADIGTDVLVCRYSDKDKNQLCFLEAKNYTFDGVLTNQLTVKIPAVSFGDEGLYMCFFVPSDETDAHPCGLTVVEAKPAGETEKGPDMLIIILTTSIGSVVVCGIFALFICLYRRRLKSRELDRPELTERLIPLQRREMETFLEGFQLSKEDLQKVMQLLEQEMSKGLDKSTKPEADVKMFQTFASYPLNHSGSGKVLVLSLGHSNLRVYLVELQENGATVQSDTYSIRHDVKVGKGKQLFAFIAESTRTFIKSHKLAAQKLPLALIIAFPCKHESLEKARLAKWTKEFNTQHVVDKDLHLLLQKALDGERHFFEKIPGVSDPLGKLEVVAVVNDVVSTLVSVAHRDSDCKICLMVDSGLNACYVEDWKLVETDCPGAEKPPEMIINTELGALGGNRGLQFCRTNYDTELDEHSISPGNQILEKMVGGVYMGEIVRLVLEKLTMEGLMLRAAPVGCDLFQRNSFITEFVMIIEGDTEEADLKTAGILENLGVLKHTDEDNRTVRRVCKLVCERAAFLTAASLAALINRINQPQVTVVVDGHIYRRHPHFSDTMRKKTLELVNPGLKFCLVSPDVEGTLNANNQPNPSGSASAIGAARIAVAALRSRNTDTASALSKDRLDGTLPAEKDSVKSPKEIEK